MGGLRLVGLGFAKMPEWGRDRGDRGGEEVRSNIVCALDGTGEDADTTEPPVRGLPALDALLSLPLCLAARRRFRISLALTV
jgi:hypothetical protein